MAATLSTSNTRLASNDGQACPDSPGPAGLLHLPDLPAELIAGAQRAIAAWLSSGFPDTELDHLTHAERMRRYTDDSYGDRALRDSANIQRIFTHYNPVVRKAVGTDTWRGLGVQIALRMPGEGGIRHIDGITGTCPADPRIPNAVLGVYLSDVGRRDGAFAVWPQLRDALRCYGTQLGNDGHVDDGRLRYNTIVEAQGREIAPYVVAGAAGTAFLFHGGLPHCNLQNLGTGIRYALFARYYRDCTYPYGFDADNAGRAWNILASPDQAWTITGELPPLEPAEGRRRASSRAHAGVAAAPAPISARRTVGSWEEFADVVTSGWAVAFHCGQPACEDDIMAATSAGPRCVPTGEPRGEERCVRCGQTSAYGRWLIFGRKY